MSEIKILQEKLSVVVHGVTEKPIKIPSQMYPLASKDICHISYNNTVPFADGPETDKIREVYDSITPGVGTCYSNIEQLIDKLAAVGIHAQPMVGWVFFGATLPVHHCFAVIENHILDFIPNFDSLAEKDEGLAKEEFRSMVVDAAIEMRTRPNSETTSFGKASRMAYYIASPCSPQAGLRMYQKLIRAFPKHPCYRNIVDGTNETQRLFFQRERQYHRF